MSLIKLTKGKKKTEKAQNTKIRNEIGIIPKDPTEVKSFLREYYKQLRTSKSDHLDKVVKLLNDINY